MSKSETKPRAATPRASADPLARAIEGAKRLRAEGFHPAVVVVGEARIELAVPAFVPSPGGRGSSTAQQPESLAAAWLPAAAAAIIDRGTPLGGAPSDDDGDDDVPAVPR